MYLNRIFNKFYGNTFNKIAINVGWLSIEKFIRLGAGLFIFGWIARYLGPDQFGLYNYVIAFVTLFGTFSTLGLTGIVVREFVRSPDKKNEILVTTFGLKMIGGVIGILTIIGITSITESDLQTRLLIIVASISMLFLPFLSIDLWYQSQVQSKFVVYAKSGAFLTTIVLYIAFILSKKPVIYFVATSVAENVFIALGLIIVFVKTGNSFKWEFKFSRAKSLLSKSWFLILSSVGALINLKVDQIMLKNLVGSETLGIYSAAAKISEIWYFIPGFIALSAFPSLIQAKESNIRLYNKRTQKLLDLMVWLALAIAIGGVIGSNFIISVLYGEQYQSASAILSLHIWAGIFIFMGEVLSKWIINEDFLVFSPIRHGLGALVNIILNLFMIPRFGGIGAAISTVISYATSSYFVCFIHPKTRPMARMMTSALFSPFRILFQRLTSIKENQK